MQVNQKKNSCAEIIAALYMNLFVLLKPILKIYSYNSTIILLGAVLLLFLFDVLFSKFTVYAFRMNKLVLLILGVSIIFAFDYIFRKNDFTWVNYYYFLIYGVIFSFFLMGVLDVKKLSFYWAVFSFIGGLICFTDPLSWYKITNDYMGFGSVMIPAFIACSLLFFFYRKRIFIVPMIIFAFDIIIYANRGATFVVAAILIFFMLCTASSTEKKIAMAVLITVVGILLTVYLQDLLNLFINIAEKIGIDSYSLKGFKLLLENSKDGSSGRTEIWQSAILEIKQNIFLGMGIGGFEAKYRNYTHNFILDILVTHGLVVALIIFAFIILAFNNTFKNKSHDFFIFSGVIGVAWVTELMTSFTYWQSPFFWQFIILNLFFSRKHCFSKTKSKVKTNESFNRHLCDGVSK